MKTFLASLLKRSTMLLGVMLVFVCARAEAQCGYLMIADYPDPVGFIECTETVYGPPTETELILLETVINTQSLWDWAMSGPLNQWSWSDFYGCLSMIAAGSGFGGIIVWLGGGPVSAAGFVGAVSGGAFGCAAAEINWYW